MHQLVLGFLLVTCATQQTRRTYIIKLGRYLEEMVILLVVMGLYIYIYATTVHIRACAVARDA
jgi:hypothetical protein